MKNMGRKKIVAACLAATLLIGGMTVGKEMSRPAVPTFAPVRTSDYQLILDAGHGGEDGGAISITGAVESEINLAVVLKLDQLLGFYGLSPILLRDSDISLHDPEAGTLHEKKVSDIHNRVATIEATPGAVVLSIHQNTFPNGAYHGAQVFYRPGGQSEALAKIVQDTLREGLDPSNKRSPAKIADTVYLMNHITCPAVLIECGFLSNAAEEAKLRSGGYQTQLALCIASAWLRSAEIGGSIANASML